MAHPTARYEPRQASHAALYRIVLDHLETFCAEAARARDGFDLHANVVAPAGDRERLERLCRYALRPPVAQERLSVTDEGDVLLMLRRPWTDGTTHLLFGPIEFLERLAALTPRPRVNLVLYYGVLGARAGWRARVVGEALARVSRRRRDTRDDRLT